MQSLHLSSKTDGAWGHLDVIDPVYHTGQSFSDCWEDWAVPESRLVLQLLLNGVLVQKMVGNFDLAKVHGPANMMESDQIWYHGRQPLSGV